MISHGAAAGVYLDAIPRFKPFSASVLALFSSLLADICSRLDPTRWLVPLPEAALPGASLEIVLLEDLLNDILLFVLVLSHISITITDPAINVSAIGLKGVSQHILQTKEYHVLFGSTYSCAHRTAATLAIGRATSLLKVSNHLEDFGLILAKIQVALLRLRLIQCQKLHIPVKPPVQLAVADLTRAPRRHRALGVLQFLHELRVLVREVRGPRVPPTLDLAGGNEQWRHDVTLPDVAVLVVDGALNLLGIEV